MHFFFYIKDLIADFLFPKDRKVLEIEALSTETLLDILPPAEPIKDSYTMALFDYSHPLVKEIVWELKYRGNIKMADKLGIILSDVIEHELRNLALFESAGWQMEKLLLMPVPISDKRRFERGWNQSELLAKQILRCSEKTFKYLPRQLIKVRHTESQTKTASRSERTKNLTDSMRVLNPSLVAGKYVIVLDDVTTTGSTFTEARRALHAAGVKMILCVAVAH